MADDDLTPIWKALSDPTRRTILDLLKTAPKTTGELADAFSALSRFAVMKHLTVLENAGLVLVRRRGRERWNHLNAVPIKAIAERWIGRYEDEWAGSLLRLKLMTESSVDRKDSFVSDVPGTGPIQIRSFRIEQEVSVAASPASVFRALTSGIGNWWFESMGGNEIFLDPRIGGYFGERSKNGDGAIYATVIRIKQDELLALNGVMGMTRPVVGVIEYKLEAIPEGTLVKLSHQVFGDLEDNTLSDYSGGWTHLLNNGLKPYVESGNPSL